MIAVISPAKQMRDDPDALPEAPGTPLLLEQSRQLLARLREYDFPTLKALLGCNEKLAQEAFTRFQRMDLDRGLTTPAILAYNGIQYQYMGPSVFTDDQFAYVQQHLRILSGFYGVLRPLDGVLPYRLEMQARFSRKPGDSLYTFWGDTPAKVIEPECGGVILNLASEEYARALRPHLSKAIRWITPLFGQLENGAVREKGVYVKMARGEMVRFLAEHQVTDPEEIQSFSRLDFHYAPERSSPDSPVFLRSPAK